MAKSTISTGPKAGKSADSGHIRHVKNFPGSGHFQEVKGRSHKDTAASALHTKQAGKNWAVFPVSYKAAETGVPSKLVRDIEGKGLTRDDIRMIISDRTLERRIAQDEPLKIEEADGIARLLRVVAHARRVFENDANADLFLRSFNPYLGEIPMKMARTDLGAREVEAVLGRIEHGVFG